MFSSLRVVFTTRAMAIASRPTSLMQHLEISNVSKLSLTDNMPGSNCSCSIISNGIV